MSGDVRRRIGALERVAGDVGAESGDGEQRAVLSALGGILREV